MTSSTGTIDARGESCRSSGLQPRRNYVNVLSIAAILILWVMYKTPFKVIEWAFNVQLRGRGGLAGLAKAGAALAIAVPAKTAIASATKSLLNRSSDGAVGG